jgi:hypothetical protein
MSVAHDPGQMQSVWERDQGESTFLPALWNSAAQDIRREYRPSLRRDHHAGDRNGDPSGVGEGCWSPQIGRPSKPRRAPLASTFSSETRRLARHLLNLARHFNERNTPEIATLYPPDLRLE